MAWPIEMRTERKREHGRQSRERPPDTSRHAPGQNQSDDTDRAAQQPARLEQTERQNFVQQCGHQVEAAAIHIEIGEGQSLAAGEAGAI